MKFLTTKATIKCCHGGKLEISPPGEREVSMGGEPILLADDVTKATISGCGQVAPFTSPCTKVLALAVGKSPKIHLPGAEPVLQTLIGITNAVPPGFVFVEDDGGSMIQLGGAPSSAGPIAEEEVHKPGVLDWSWIELEVADEQGTPLPGKWCRIQLPNGKAIDAVTDKTGLIRATRLPKGTCRVSFPELGSSVLGGAPVDNIIEGELLWEVGLPMANSGVELVNGAGEVLAESTTDEAGRYHFRGEYNGPLSVRSTEELKEEPRGIHVRLVDASSLNLMAHVEVVYAEYGEPRTAMTDPEGVLLLTGLSDLYCTLSINGHEVRVDTEREEELEGGVPSPLMLGAHGVFSDQGSTEHLEGYLHSAEEEEEEELEPDLMEELEEDEDDQSN